MRAVEAGLALILAVSPLGAQEATDPMVLNRQGRWAEAALLAETMLETSGDLSLNQRCELRSSLAHAYQRTRRAGQARAEATTILTECTSLPAGHYVLRDAKSMLGDLVPAAPPTNAQRDDGWPVGNVTQMGLNAGALEAHEQLCRNSGAEACLVAVDGSIVQEWYSPTYFAPITTMSSVKSWTALLAGILIERGTLGLDDPVSKWIPEWQAGARAGVTVRHLLTMTSGLRNRTSDGVGGARDKNVFVFDLPLDWEPGTRWAYSNEGVQLLSPILERAAGRPLEDFAREELFEPLQMHNTSLGLDATGSPRTYDDASTTLRDFARICEVALRGGTWAGRQVVPADWIQTVVTPQPLAPDARYGVEAYGMLWWLNRDPVAYMTKGFLETDCYAFPEHDVVIARMQRTDGTAPQVSYSFSRVAEIVRQLVGP